MNHEMAVYPEPHDRRAEDREDAVAKEAGWQAYLEALGADRPTTVREAYIRSLEAYRREITTLALRRQLMAGVGQ